MREVDWVMWMCRWGPKSAGSSGEEGNQASVARVTGAHPRKLP